MLQIYDLFFHPSDLISYCFKKNVCSVPSIFFFIIYWVEDRTKHLCNFHNLTCKYFMIIKNLFQKNIDICLRIGLKRNKSELCVSGGVISSERTRQMNVMWSVSANMQCYPFEQTPIFWFRARAAWLGSERVCFAATALYELIISAALARIIQRARSHTRSSRVRCRRRGV